MPDPIASKGIDLDQVILLTSRVFAAFLLFWVVDDIIAIPQELFSVMHYFHESTQAGVGLFEALRYSYLLALYTIYLLANILRIALWLLAAGWFYRCGPRIRSFFAFGFESLSNGRNV
jgi:hypothetical protein